ncbi:DUF732 domain-containing protein [Corynebacterium pygosceleis]|uniref:DUF732 domain-containing protein n=1 Tax=Corynebacterium pygosceleis TaxID=2800406 RepID=A0A9Q4C8Z6_9CORY|nr:DUF732 domain-containing protein [Corynebacterium pygosceleis]MCK7638256.1 DUF732 domain-containing protein [Corynebacterium pygosceleis]MCL0121370.1 DUF732 domain-containing protein [Corynebacterium pygosceleis]MCX7468917.1 DUF732 domain-containing protein [Corynebacterium pygosceleis]
MRRLTLPLLTVAVLALAGCGGATSESGDATAGDTTATSSPLPKAESKTPGADESDEEKEARESSLSSASPEYREAAPQPVVPAVPEPRDGAAKEIDEIPGLSQDRSASDMDYLKALKDGGISVDGVEDQMIGAAAEVCRSAASGVDNYTLEAVAGQLVEQERASAPVPEIAERIASAAKSAYC